MRTLVKNVLSKASSMRYSLRKASGIKTDFKNNSSTRMPTKQSEHKKRSKELSKYNECDQFDEWSISLFYSSLLPSEIFRFSFHSFFNGNFGVIEKN